MVCLIHKWRKHDSVWVGYGTFATNKVCVKCFKIKIKINYRLGKAAYVQGLKDGFVHENPCRFCLEDIKGRGNSSQPLCYGKCCNSCDEEYVMPFRLKESKK